MRPAVTSRRTGLAWLVLAVVAAALLFAIRPRREVPAAALEARTAPAGVVSPPTLVAVEAAAPPPAPRADKAWRAAEEFKLAFLEHYAEGDKAALLQLVSPRDLWDESDRQIRAGAPKGVEIEFLSPSEENLRAIADQGVASWLRRSKEERQAFARAATVTQASLLPDGSVQALLTARIDVSDPAGITIDRDAGVLSDGLPHPRAVIYPIHLARRAGSWKAIGLALP